MNVNIKLGDTWNPALQILADGSPKDCTGLECKMVVNEWPTGDDPQLTIPISWTDQAQGQGTFDLTHANSLALGLGSFKYEVKLYKSDDTYVKTPDTGRLNIMKTNDSTPN
jgi:hypothetical protein